MNRLHFVGSWLALALFLVGIGSVTVSKAQLGTVSDRQAFLSGRFAVQWADSLHQFPDPQYAGVSHEGYVFEGCAYDEQVLSLPQYHRVVPVANGQAFSVRVTEANATEESFSGYAAYVKWAQETFDLFGENEWYPAQPIVVGEPAIERGNAYVPVTYYPLQVHRSGQRIRRYQELRYSVQPVAARKTATRKASFANNSVLSSGNWFKIAVSEGGLYRLGYEDLQQLGLNPDNLDPRSLRVYGTGGRMLPRINTDPRYDDLAETPIRVLGEADGRFDPGDQLVFYAEGPGQWTWFEGENTFRHNTHLYSRQNYYFITVDKGVGKRVTTQAASGAKTASRPLPLVANCSWTATKPP